MDPQSINRALMSSGLWFAVSWGIALAAGVDAPIMEIATDAGLMGGAALASDAAHAALNVIPSAMTSAVGAGAFYTGLQRAWRGDDSYVSNFVAAAGNDYLVEFAGSALSKSS